MNRRSPIPTVETYRGVDLHDQQDEQRLTVVRADVDAAFALAGDVARLVGWAEDRSRAPESRQLARALALAEYDLAAEERRARPSIDRERLAATTAGLGTTRSRLFYDSVYSPLSPAAWRGDPGAPIRRAQPLSD